MGLGRGVALCAAAALLVTGCSGSDGGQEAGDDPPGPAASSSAPPADLGVQRVVDPLAPGAIDLVRVLPKPRYRSEYGSAEVRAAFTPDLAVFGDTRGNLWAVDRRTGRPRWHVPMRSSLPGGDTVCSLTIPAPDADVVVANHGGGDLCGDFTVYDLATGDVTLQYSSIPAESRDGLRLPSNLGLFRLGDSTYWVDADDHLRRIDPDGDSSIVGTPTLLDARYDGWNLSRFQVLPGTDLFVARMVPLREFDPQSFGKPNDDGDLIGFRIGEDHRLELVWQHSVRRLMAASPGHVKDSFGMRDELPGLVADVLRKRGNKYLRYQELDPRTGNVVGPGVVTAYDGMRPGGPGAPGLAEEYGPDQALVAGEHTVFSPYEVPKRNGFTRLVRYDMTTGEPEWTWHLPGAMTSDFPPSMDVLGITPDRSAVYVYTAMDFDNEIHELDYETGKQRHAWQLPEQQSYAYELDFAPTYLDGDQVLQVNGHATSDEKVLAALLTVGR